jgi:hypothetical protein
MTNRQKLIQLVHIGAGKLFPKDDDARRAWQEQHTGKTSCSKMSNEELEVLVKLLKEAKAITVKPPKRAGRKPFNPSPYMKKIEAMLSDMQLSWQYAEAIAWRLTGGKGERTGQPGMVRLEWVKKREHFEGIIAALHQEQKKRQLLNGIEHCLNALNLHQDYVEKLIAGRKNAEKWQRDLPLLQATFDHLYEKLEFMNAAQ